MPLIDHADSILVVIDVQEGFYGDSLPPDDGARAREALARMTWLAKVARRLSVPAVFTEEDPQRNGATFSPIADVFPDARAAVKPTFGLTGTPELVDRIESTHRTTAVLIGFETDVSPSRRSGSRSAACGSSLSRTPSSLRGRCMTEAWRAWPPRESR